MIIVLNGYPGVGKLTIGRELANLLQGRLLDIHSVYNVAFALTEFKSPEFRATVDKIEAIAYDLIYKLPDDQPVVLTTVLAGDSGLAETEWQKIVALGAARPPFCVVHVNCSLEENIHRIKSPDRVLKLKPQDPEYAIRNQREAKTLAGISTQNLLQLEASDLSPKNAAQRIADWANAL